MATKKLSVLAQVVLKDGSDLRKKTVTITDTTVVEAEWVVRTVPGGTTANTSKISFGGITSAKKKWVLIESDRTIKVNWVTRSGAVDLTTGLVNGFGDVVHPNGCLLICGTGNTTSLWITNKYTTAACNVSVAVFAASTT